MSNSATFFAITSGSSKVPLTFLKYSSKAFFLIVSFGLLDNILMLPKDLPISEITPDSFADKAVVVSANFKYSILSTSVKSPS